MNRYMYKSETGSIHSLDEQGMVVTQMMEPVHLTIDCSNPHLALNMSVGKYHYVELIGGTVDLDNHFLPMKALVFHLSNCTVIGEGFVTRKPGKLVLEDCQIENLEVLDECFPNVTKVECLVEHLPFLPLSVHFLELERALTVDEAKDVLPMYPDLRSVPIQIDHMDQVPEFMSMFLRCKLKTRMIQFLVGNQEAIKEIFSRVVAHTLLSRNKISKEYSQFLWSLDL